MKTMSAATFMAMSSGFFAELGGTAAFPTRSFHRKAVYASNGHREVTRRLRQAAKIAARVAA